MCTFIEGICAIYCANYKESLESRLPPECEEIRMYVDVGEEPVRWSQLPDSVTEVIVSFLNARLCIPKSILANL